MMTTNNHDRCFNVIASLIESAGGEIEVPWETVELARGYEVRTWERIRDGRVVLVWAGKPQPEIQGRDEEAYAAWRADLIRQAVDEWTTTVLQETRSFDSRRAWLAPGAEWAVGRIRDLAGLDAPAAGGALPVIIGDDVPWPDGPETPESWAIPA